MQFQRRNNFSNETCDAIVLGTMRHDDEEQRNGPGVHAPAPFEGSQIEVIGLDFCSQGLLPHCAAIPLKPEMKTLSSSLLLHHILHNGIGPEVMPDATHAISS